LSFFGFFVSFFRALLPLAMVCLLVVHHQVSGFFVFWLSGSADLEIVTAGSDHENCFVHAPGRSKATPDSVRK
jgi:hypothetical protein